VAGDLGSHVYNAWLAQLVEQGKAPGVYIVTQWKNVLFDLMLFYFAKLFGLMIAEKIAVSICVLVFFWGVFAFASAVAEQFPWFLTPVIAMLSYGYVFYMGFMNYYLSIGLASFALALMWSGTKRSFGKALLLAPLIYLAHPIGFLFFAGVASYRLLWMKLHGWLHLLLPLSVLALAVAIRFYFMHHPEFEPNFEQNKMFTRNGSDQLAIYGFRFSILSQLVLLFSLICAALDVRKYGRNLQYWKQRKLILELCFAAFCVTTFVPQDFRPDPNAGWVGVIVTRLTVISAIFALCWLATLQPRKWYLAGYGATAIVFFVFTYQDTAQLNRLEASAEQITRQLPFGTRVLATIFENPHYRPMFIHAVERACIGHCFVYSNYEPSALAFRIRVKPGSPVVVSSPDDSEDMQSGTYEVQDEDLPLKQIYQCDPQDLTRICIRDLSPGELNDRLGYHP
jgi:hypothetical protein